MPDAILGELANGASHRRGTPWGDAIRDSVARGEVTGIPIAEYLTYRLVECQMALVGDAAHVPMQMTIAA